MSKNKILLGTAGLTTAAIVAWRSLYPALGYDIRTIFTTNRMAKNVGKTLESGMFLIDTFESNVTKHPNKTCIIYEDRVYSYGFVDAMANKVANIASTWDLGPSDTVATMIQNEPAFIWTLLGLLKIGIADAFINYHLTAEPLIHSLKVSECKVIIVGHGEDLMNAILEIENDLPDVPVFVMGKTQSDLQPKYLSFDDVMLKTLPVPVCRSVRSHIEMISPMCFIYTSGTTGLPKPVIVNQAKAIGLSKTYRLVHYSSKDTLYIVTPLYHSAATLLGVCSSLDVGATMVIRKTFSASHFWEDVRRHDVTVIQYIGELCRYLLNVPKSPRDGVHKLRIACGNGLRPDIWHEFQSRFKIPQIAEFFGATEGTSGLVNLNNKCGACGRMSPLLKRFAAGGPSNIQLIKYDLIEDAPIRDRNGRCIKIKPGEEGLVISPMPRTYTGFYKGGEDLSEKKIMRNVFAEGDAYFSFGDILSLDKDYYVYFRDRIGDTFRWKGENVSTREVTGVISALKVIDDVNIYGVKIEGMDGRAGMAAVKLKADQKISSDVLESIYRKCEHDLPSYARPLFIRFQKEFIVTQTMKHRKLELIKDGFDPNKITDPLYVLDRTSQSYIPLTTENVSQVLTSKL